jgi:hypothetical protein
MICNACGEIVDRVDHVIFVDGEALCRALYESDTGDIMNQTITNDAGETLGTMEERINDGHIVWSPTCSCGQYGGTFENFREAVYWLTDEEPKYHATLPRYVSPFGRTLAQISEEEVT